MTASSLPPAMSPSWTAHDLGQIEHTSVLVVVRRRHLAASLARIRAAAPHPRTSELRPPLSLSPPLPPTTSGQPAARALPPSHVPAAATASRQAQSPFHCRRRLRARLAAPAGDRPCPHASSPTLTPYACGRAPSRPASAGGAHLRPGLLAPPVPSLPTANTMAAGVVLYEKPSLLLPPAAGPVHLAPDTSAPPPAATPSPPRFPVTLHHASSPPRTTGPIAGPPPGRIGPKRRLRRALRLQRHRQPNPAADPPVAALRCRRRPPRPRRTPPSATVACSAAHSAVAYRDHRQLSHQPLASTSPLLAPLARIRPAPLAGIRPAPPRQGLPSPRSGRISPRRPRIRPSRPRWRLVSSPPLLERAPPPSADSPELGARRRRPPHGRVNRPRPNPRSDPLHSTSPDPLRVDFREV
nr:nascent polypeptide-associated complex subunit alpha, muscle-specific form-like [Aegilops tauschii subsp. strangulata]